MAQQGESPVLDKHYNLISVLEDSLQNVGRLDTYIKDAESQGDNELAEWFRKIQHNNRKAGDQGKAMLAQRLNQ